MIARAREHTKRKRIELRAWVRDYLAAHPCVDCGEADPVVLEFDHRDPATKDKNIADAISRNGWGLKRLQAEIEKCDVRCCNCHRRRTVSEQHWLLGSLPKPEPGLPALQQLEIGCAPQTVPVGIVWERTPSDALFPECSSPADP